MSAAHAVDAEVRLYDRLFTVEDPESASAKAGREFTSLINPASLETLSTLQGRADARTRRDPGARYQFERLGYFCADPDSQPRRPVFNRTVSLKDSWGKILQKPL